MMPVNNEKIITFIEHLFITYQKRGNTKNKLVKVSLLTSSIRNSINIIIINLLLLTNKSN